MGPFIWLLFIVSVQQKMWHLCPFINRGSSWYLPENLPKPKPGTTTGMLIQNKFPQAYRFHLNLALYETSHTLWDSVFKLFSAATSTTEVAVSIQSILGRNKNLFHKTSIGTEEREINMVLFYNLFFILLTYNKISEVDPLEPSQTK